jgi:hypothetical protein
MSSGDSDRNRGWGPGSRKGNWERTPLVQRAKGALWAGMNVAGLVGASHYDPHVGLVLTPIATSGSYALNSQTCVAEKGWSYNENPHIGSRPVGARLA